jgi:tripartite-type tricarboxylate transporter receptor subunit TctC
MIKTTAVLACSIVCALAALQARAAAAEPAFPAHQIRLIVSSPAGSTPDTGARAVAQAMSQDLGQPVVVENRPGANGLIAVQETLKSADDGYTLLVAPGSTMTINPHVYGKQAAVVLTDLAAVGEIYSTDFYLIVRPDSGINSMQDLIRKAKEKPGALVAANGGPGSASQMAVELLKQETGTDLYQVSFNGSPAGALAVAAGNADLLIETQAVTEPFVSSGRVKRLAMTGQRRAAALPDLPTMAEAGVPGMEISSWAGIFVRVSVPAAKVERLNAALNHALAQRDIQAVLRNGGLMPGAGTKDQFQREWHEQSDRWAQVVARTPGLKNN